MRSCATLRCGRRSLGAWLILLLAGCAADEPPLMTSVADTPRKAPIVVARPAPARATASAAPAAPPAAPPAEAEPAAVLYFDTDVYTVKDDDLPLLQAHAKRLRADPSLRLRIDAYTDDTGPVEYNQELARMRAHTVMKQLLALGVSPKQLQIVGHGEGGPAAKGRGGRAQAESRRVELVYR